MIADGVPFNNRYIMFLNWLYCMPDSVADTPMIANTSIVNNIANSTKHIISTMLVCLKHQSSNDSFIVIFLCNLTGLVVI